MIIKNTIKIFICFILDIILTLITLYSFYIIYDDNNIIGGIILLGGIFLSTLISVVLSIEWVKKPP
jgi:arginine exporter protein ArgO